MVRRRGVGMRSYVTTLENKRTLSWAEYGSVARDMVVVHQHANPSSRLELAFLEDALTELGVHVIVPERPGYGASIGGHAARRLTQWAVDVECLLDYVGI